MIVEQGDRARVDDLDLDAVLSVAGLGWRRLAEAGNRQPVWRCLTHRRAKKSGIAAVMGVPVLAAGQFGQQGLYRRRRRRERRL